MKIIRFSHHALDQMRLRGATQVEVRGMLLKQSRGSRRSVESIRSAKRMRSGGPHPSIDRFIPSKQFTLFLLMSQMKLSSSQFWAIMGTGEWMMKIHYDAEVDALYIEFRPLADGTAEARPLGDELIANYGPDGRLAGLEILDASQVLGQAEGRLIFEIAPALAPTVLLS